MSAAKIDSAGKVVQLGPKPTPEETVTAEDVQDPAKLAKLATRILAALANLRRQWAPGRLDFEDLACDGAGAALTLQHNFAGRVRWWVTDWTSGSSACPILIRGTETTADTLVLYSYQAGTATLRVEESG